MRTSRPAQHIRSLVGRTWPLLPVGVAATYVVALMTQFSGLIVATYGNSDAASAPVIGQLYDHGASGQVVLGYLPWYSTLLFEHATRWLPSHRVLWEAAPYLMAFGSAILIGYAVRRAADLRAGLTSAALVLCAGPTLLLALFSLDDHSPTWFSIAVLGALLAFVLTRPVATPSILAGILAGVVVGLNAGSDSLLVVGGMLPAALATVSVACLHRSPTTRRQVGLLGASLGVAVASALIITDHYRSAGVIPKQRLFAFANPDQVATNARLWWQSLAYLGNGGFFGTKPGFTSLLEAGGAVLVVVGAVILPRVAWTELRAPSEIPAPRLAHVVFFATSAGLLTATYVFGNAPLDVSSGRYLIGVLYATAALLPLLRGARRTLVTVAAVVYCLSGLVSILQRQTTGAPGASQYTLVASQVAAIAERDHLSRGFASYWDAADLTWASHMRTLVYPAMTCAQYVCPFFLHTIASWYTPLPGTRSFVITDPAVPFLQSLPATVGRPIATYHLARGTMYVFADDVAARFSTCPPNCS